MPETFLILLAAGIMLAAGVSDSKQVTLSWLRLCGILALVMAGLSMYFAQRLWMLNAVAALAILGQLAFTQVAFRRTQQIFAWVAFLLGLRVAVIYLNVPALIAYASGIGIAAMCGLVLMDMLLGHAYLTASKMTIAPLLRLNSILAGTLIWRTLIAVGGTMLLQHYRQVYLLWGQHSLFILTRWLIGLIIPAVFIYMAHDCIQRRSTQSATGILYVAGVLIFIGEIVALYLVRATALPF